MTLTRFSSCLILAAVALALLALGPLSSCKQKEGETCQTSSDCKSGLVCCFGAAGASSTLGVCTVGDTCTPIDAAPPADASALDAASQEIIASWQDDPGAWSSSRGGAA